MVLFLSNFFRLLSDNITQNRLNYTLAIIFIVYSYYCLLLSLW